LEIRPSIELHLFRWTIAIFFAPRDKSTVINSLLLGSLQMEKKKSRERRLMEILGVTHFYFDNTLFLFEWPQKELFSGHMTPGESSK